MHGCNSASVFIVNAEVDSMGGVVEDGVTGTKTSPRRAAIEKVQAELRQEYDVREERRRELEFLEKGGNPLDFNFGKATSVSVQSTSPTDQPAELIVTSEAKGSFPFTASPHGDSVESSGRPGAHSACEPNSADNLMLFDGDNDSVDGDRSSAHPNRTSIAPSEHSSQQGGSHNAKELGDSATFSFPKKAYKRRFRPSRDGVRPSSTDAVFGRSPHGSSLSSQHASKETKGLVSEEKKVKEQKVTLNSDSKTLSPNGVPVSKTVPSEGQLDVEVGSGNGVESATNLIKNDLPANIVSSNTSKDIQRDQHDHKSAVDSNKSLVVPLGDTINKGKEEVVPVTEVKNQSGTGQVNGFDSTARDDNLLASDGQNNSAAPATKLLDSESSCAQASFSIDRNNVSEMCTDTKIVGSNGNFTEQTTLIPPKPNVEGELIVEEKKETKVDDRSTLTENECNLTQQSQKDNGFVLKAQEEINDGGSAIQDNSADPNQSEPKHQIVESMEIDDCNRVCSGTETNAVPPADNLDPSSANICNLRPECTDSSVLSLPKTASPDSVPITATDGHKSSDMNSEANKIDEDTILEEARIIEAKRKKIAELSMANLSTRNHRRSHWDSVLEEMSWLANDFAQERIWKLTAAAKMCHLVTSTTRFRFLEQTNCREHKKVAHILANAVMEFWLSVEEKRELQELQYSRKDGSFALREYAVRFLKHNTVDVLYTPAEAPKTPDRISDLGISGMSWEDHLTEENLFYTVLPGAAESYRRSIESRTAKYEKTGSSVQEEVETSACEVVPDFGYQDHVYEEDEDETSTYDTSVAFDGSRSSRFSHKKWKNSPKAYNSRSYEVVAESPFMQCMENRAGIQQHVQLGKRPASSLHVSFPTKRTRTNIRPRVISPFGPGPSGSVQITPKTDASSGDTNSFQDDQSTMHGGSNIPNNLEVESMGDFEKQLPFDSVEISTKNKKKKKPKHLGSGYEHGWQVDTNFQRDQRDYSKKRSDGHQLESNGSSGMYGQHIAKKPKTMRQSLDNSYESGAPVGGSAPSPVASQISNQNKIMKMLTTRGRKNKGSKMPAGEMGSGSPWTLFEEQALVVLVHDLGPNWELVSDAINSTLQFKCIFRNPKECKERHKILMDRTVDGADSTEDSGSSQPYNSTLPGIPKGQARQLFQRLQGPMEEDTLRCHFDKIIMLGQKLHSRRKQNDMQDPKQLQPPHNSHMFALNQYIPNYLNGGPPLTPLDLCDATAPSNDMLTLGYQGQPGGMHLSPQTPMTPMLNGSGVNSSAAGSSNMVVGNNFSSSPNQVNTSVRDARYVVPRSASLSNEEQQRMQQYGQLLPGRNLPQSNSPSSGGLPGNDRGVRMLPGGNGMGIASGINRNSPVARPGFQGIASSSMLNSGSMISPGMVAIQSPVNMHPGVGSGQGNTIRPRDALHLMRPNQNSDPQRQMQGPELQIQASQGSNPGIAPYGAIGSSFPNQAGSPPVASYQLHNQQSHGMAQQQPHVHHPNLQGTNHVSSPQHQAYATARLVKERQLQQQRIMQQHQQQFSSSNSMMPHVQPPSQLPISSPQSSSQVQPQTSPAASLSPLTSASPVASQQQQKHQGPPHGHARNAQSSGSGPTNSLTKPRQRQSQQPQQQFQQSGRHHPQPRQQLHPQQQAKIMKSVGRGNVMMHQNIPIDPSLLNGLSTNPANQTVEKGEQPMHLLHGQGLYSGTAMNPVQTGKQPVPHSSSQSQPQHKILSQVPPLAKHLQQMPSHSDTPGQDHISPVASSPVSTGHQSVQPLIMPSSNHQPTQVQTNQKLGNLNQSSVQRVSQQNRHMNSDLSSKLQGGETQSSQNSTSNSSQIGAMATTPKTSNDATNGMQVLSPASGPQWRASDPLYDSGTSSPVTTFSPVGTSPTISSGSEPLSQSGQKGLGSRQSSGNFPPVGMEVGAQWQQSSQVQQSPSPVSQQQLLPSHQQMQLPSQQNSQQQGQLGGNGSNLFVRSSDSRLE
ncbi:OLC1v1006779C1 [Oldenlandia corymbosa var. corymbosa]|uniref:OLC1v1006779C1 n=1 Tax=Oldenlandia corymbosa var. corymbosa TaxID=529605 RepID=A0AAV1DHT7_OLDCO|nr:OLC1v1006779C1 [Oldenlandia corymbosa var. corymbosa]